MSQAILLDINPPERHGPAMAIWGMGAILGPIVGPALGGWLTDNFTWRWVFYINLPVGVLAFFGLTLFLGETRSEEHTSELQSLMRISYAVFCLKKKNDTSLQLS